MKGKPIIGVWRSWLAHLVWDQRVLCSSHSTPTKRDDFNGHLFFCFILSVARNALVINCLPQPPCRQKGAGRVV